MVRLPTLIYFYGKRLRVHAVQELFAGLGIAAGVALVFSVQVANSSIVASARQILHGITGNASLQIAARDSQGVDASTLVRVRALPGVAHAAPLFEQRATVVFRGHRVAIDLVGVDGSLSSLGGVTARGLLVGGISFSRGLVLPSAVGTALRLLDGGADGKLRDVSLAVRGRGIQAPVLDVLGPGAVGAVSGAMVAVTSLRYAQDVTGLANRITRVVIVPRPGQERAVRAGLERISAGRLKVASVDEETQLLDQATGPIDQATGLFAAISALVGLLFTFNAMLLTVPERRRFIADMRMQGWKPRRLVQILGFQAIVLGSVASVVGLVVGYFLSRSAANSPPGYLSFAFPLGIEPVIAPQTVVLAFLGGLVATCLAAAQPLADLRRGQPLNAVFKQKGVAGHAISVRARDRLAVVAGALVVATTALLLVAPSLTVLGLVAIAVATVLAIPAILGLVLRVSEGPAVRSNRNTLAFAIRALRATTVRSLALAATGAVAVFGSVAIEGAHRNLIGGLNHNFADYLGTADLWVTSGGDENSLTTQSFQLDPRALQRARAVPGVAAAYPYYGGMLDVGPRRVWVIGRPTADRQLIPPSQITHGDLAVADQRVRSGGWVAASESIARSQHAGLGDRITLPTPAGNRSYRLAALLTNLGWGPGAVIMRAGDYRSAWMTSDPSAIEIGLRPGADAAAAQHAIQAALDPNEIALRVQTTAQRDAQFRGLARQGLQRLSNISRLLLIAAVLAMVAAMVAGIWQRRAAYAQLQIMGWRPRKLWRTLLIETGIVLGTGCIAGAIAGIYGHLLGNRWLEITTGYPAPFSLSPGPTILTCVIVGAAAVAGTAIPGYLVARAPLRLGLKPNG
jgi:putative ABC transport system permease protein